MHHFKRRLVLTHLYVSSAILVLMLLLFLMLDYAFNGFFADLMVGSVGYNLTRWFVTRKELALSIMILIIEFFGWAIVEYRFMKKLAHVVEQMDKLILKNDSMIILDKQFKQLENNLNHIKMENIKNEQLAQVEIQRKNDLIAYLAHDIKTPLASIIGYLTLLDEVPDMPIAQKAKYTKITLNKAYRLEQLINEFFDITRFNLSTIPLEKEKMNLEFMLAQLADEFYPMLASCNRKAEVQVTPDLYVSADPDKLARVFNNILKNAIAYSYENTIIKIVAYPEHEKVVITFTNRGREIPEEKRNMIFEKFFRLDSARSSNSGGSGLGLAIAKEIVKAHHGTIAVTSKNETTTFTVVLPVR